MKDNLINLSYFQASLRMVTEEFVYHDMDDGKC